jgi:hypothetical protein
MLSFVVMWLKSEVGMEVQCSRLRGVGQTTAELNFFLSTHERQLLYLEQYICAGPLKGNFYMALWYVFTSLFNMQSGSSFGIPGV